MYDEEDMTLKMFQPCVPLGNTRSKRGLYRLVVALQRLKTLVMVDYWPGSRAYVLEGWSG